MSLTIFWCNIKNQNGRQDDHREEVEDEQIFCKHEGDLVHGIDDTFFWGMKNDHC